MADQGHGGDHVPPGWPKNDHERAARNSRGWYGLGFSTKNIVPDKDTESRKVVDHKGQRNDEAPFMITTGNQNVYC